MKNLNNKEVFVITIVVWLLMVFVGGSSPASQDSAYVAGYYFGKLIVSFFIAVVIDLVLMSFRKK